MLLRGYVAPYGQLEPFALAKRYWNALVPAKRNREVRADFAPKAPKSGPDAKWIQ